MHYDVVIVGGGAGGLELAAQLGRKLGAREGRDYGRRRNAFEKFSTRRHANRWLPEMRWKRKYQCVETRCAYGPITAPVNPFATADVSRPASAPPSNVVKRWPSTL